MRAITSTITLYVSAVAVLAFASLATSFVLPPRSSIADNHHLDQDVAGLKPVHLRELLWQDVNIISTTDTHGWLQGHRKQASYSADMGDFAAFVFHMRQQARLRRKDLFVVDSGDLHHGTGLVDAPALKGHLTNPVFDLIDYDALTIGNHEVTDNDIALDTYKNFAPLWKDRYLTSNVYIMDQNSNTTVPLANRFTTIKGQFGTTVGVFGFLFNMPNPASQIKVEFSTVTVTQPWFLEALKVKVDMYLILGHVPIRGPEVTAVLNAIRKLYPTVPISVVGGHSHIRDHTIYDGRAFGLQSGKFLETIGWMSLGGIKGGNGNVVNGTMDSNNNTKNLTVERRYLDTNLYSYKFHSLSHPRQQFSTWKGEEIKTKLEKIRQGYDLDLKLGTAPKDYYIDRVPFNHSSSIMNLATEKVLPLLVKYSKTQRPGTVIINTTGLRYDIFKGKFSLDDTFIVCPYNYAWNYLTVNATVAKGILGVLNKPGAPVPSPPTSGTPPNQDDKSLTLGLVTNDDRGYGGDDWPHLVTPKFALPNFVASDLGDQVKNNGTDLVDVVFFDFQLKTVGNAIKSIDPTFVVPTTAGLYNEQFNANTIWREFAEKEWV